MDLYFRSDTLELVTSPTFLRAPTRVDLVRGDTPDLVVRFVDPATATVVDAFGAGSTWLFSAKPAGDFAADPLTSTTGVTRTGTGATTKYVLAPSLNTTELNTALGVGGETELPYLDTDAQFQITYAGKVSSTAKFTLRVNNDVARSDDPLTNDASNSAVITTAGIVAYGIQIVPTLILSTTGSVIASVTGNISSAQFIGPRTDIATIYGGSSTLSIAGGVDETYAAFYSCTALTTVTLPACTSVGKYTFASCTALTHAILPGCTTLDDAAFYNCTALTAVTLKTGCSIGTAAIPEGVTITYV